MSADAEPRTRRGLLFRDTDGLMRRSYQLLNAGGYAVATADFHGTSCVRFLAADSVRQAASWQERVKQTVQQLESAPEDGTPLPTS